MSVSFAPKNVKMWQDAFVANVQLCYLSSPNLISAPYILPLSRLSILERLLGGESIVEAFELVICLNVPVNVLTPLHCTSTNTLLLRPNSTYPTGSIPGWV